MALLDYRYSPIDDTILSPVQKVFGRRLITKLSTATSLLKSRYEDDVRKSLKHRQSKQKHYHDKHILKQELKPLKAGENVVVQ